VHPPSGTRMMVASSGRGHFHVCSNIQELIRICVSLHGNLLVEPFLMRMKDHLKQAFTFLDWKFFGSLLDFFVKLSYSVNYV
jgi:hypothetical protein